MDVAPRRAGGFWDVVTGDQALAALKLSFGLAVVVTLLNAVLGTITAWVLVRDEFRGKSLVNAVIDLPFALPTIVAGLTLLALYGPRSPIGIDVAFTRTAIALSLLFVTLPFVVRTVQPVLLELDREAEQAARVARRVARRPYSGGSCCRRSCPGSSPASRSRSRGRWARSARSC